MKRQIPRVVFLSLASLALAAGGCAALHPSGGKFEPVQAQVRRSFDSQSNAVLNASGQFSTQARVINDPAEVRKLASFFPGMGQAQKEKHPAPSAYIPSIEIQFIDAGHHVVNVTSDYVLWNDGHGDRNVASGFVQYIDKLFAGAK